MKRFLNTLFFTLLLAGIAGAGIFAGYNAINIKKDKPIGIPLENTINKAFQAESGEAPLTKPGDMPEPRESPVLLKSDAVLKFEYYYRSDGSVLTKEQSIPYFLAGKGQEDLQEVFVEWAIEDYSENGAVLRKEVLQEAVQNYLITTVDGYIAVYYDEGIDGSKLKEVTDTPVSALPEAERERLDSGIRVQGENALMRLLEDFSS